jgi:GH25 family lysozyme M1 (1,4-beta-N-acetylmuramidase)
MDGLLVDIYAEDANGHPDVTKLEAAGFPWIGCSMKFCQGTYYHSPLTWLQTYWPLARKPANYGTTWFRQAYDYVDVRSKDARASAKAQFEYLMKYVQLAGGFGCGDLPVGLDVEQADNPVTISAQQIIDTVSMLAALIELETGQKPICYGGSYLRDHGIKDHMGCQAPWVARYASTLPPDAYKSLGYDDVKDVFGWQYESTEGFTGPKGYPLVSPLGHTDISAVIWAGGGEAGMQRMRDHRLK